MAAAAFAITNHGPHVNARSQHQKDAMASRQCVLKDSMNFKKAFFACPTAPKSFMFKNFNLVIEVGESVAFVGPSGSEKSNASRSSLRTHDDVHGEALIDSH